MSLQNPTWAIICVNLTISKTRPIFRNIENQTRPVPFAEMSLAGLFFFFFFNTQTNTIH